MKLKEEDVVRIAKLAKLNLSFEEITKFQEQLSKVVDYFEKLKEVDTENVEPTSQTTGLENVFREDQIDNRSLSKEECLSGTEETHNDYFLIPCVFEKSNATTKKY